MDINNESNNGAFSATSAIDTYLSPSCFKINLTLKSPRRGLELSILAMTTKTVTVFTDETALLFKSGSNPTPRDGGFVPRADVLPILCVLSVWGGALTHVMFCSVNPEIHPATCCKEEQHRWALFNILSGMCYRFKFLHMFISDIAIQAAGFLSFFIFFADNSIHYLMSML